ncbi:MAG TPA: ABC transporter permease [Methylomirabilota bacterium]|jgi:simple sugar transport system permease protein|nr:ABC transporter permease [Methylomirabilota bacterium]
MTRRETRNPEGADGEPSESNRSPSPWPPRRWLAPALLPAINLALALALSAVVVLLVGENPARALRLLVTGAFGNAEAIGYTLYYATSFVFTGLAVAVAFHGGLFNIGAEGQAYIGGLGVALLCLAAGGWPTVLVVPAAILVGALGGAAWAFAPGWLQARRGSHVVITTIMFNFIAAALMTHLLVNVLIRPGQQSPETREFAPNTWLPQFHDVARSLGWEIARSPLNFSALIALAAGAVVWLYLWHTRWGYELRALGHSETAAVYGGIVPARIIVVAMSISGALAGLMSLNEVMGVHHRLLLNFPGGAGYVGIAVALMGRNHPAGIVLAAVLFGALYQGGSELSFDMPTLTRDMVVVIQGLIILVCGAFEQALRRPVEALFRRPATAAE